MKNKTIVLLMSILGFVQISFAQPESANEAEIYTYWAKRGIVEATYAYMKDVDPKTDIERTNRDTFNEKFVKKIIFNKDEISNLLKNGSWVKTEQQIFQKLLKNYNDKKQFDKDFFTVPAANGDSYSSENWNKVKSKISDNYVKSINKFREKSSNQEAKTDVLSQKTVVKESQERVSRKSDGKTKKIQLFCINLIKKSLPILTLIIAFFLGAFMIYFITHLTIKQILEKEYLKYSSDYKNQNVSFMFQYFGVIYILLQKKDEYKKSLEKSKYNSSLNNKRIEDENFRLIRKIIELEEDVLHYKRKNSSETPNVVELDVSKNKKEIIEEVEPIKFQAIYFTIPEPDGSFKESDADTVQNDNHYFKIQYKEGEDKGELFYLSSDYDLEAINDLDSYLKPVAMVENASNTSATRIQHNKTGKVVKSSNRWIIDRNNKLIVKLY